MKKVIVNDVFFFLFNNVNKFINSIGIYVFVYNKIVSIVYIVFIIFLKL